MTVLPATMPLPRACHLRSSQTHASVTGRLSRIAWIVITDPVGVAITVRSGEAVVAGAWRRRGRWVAVAS